MAITAKAAPGSPDHLAQDREYYRLRIEYVTAHALLMLALTTGEAISAARRMRAAHAYLIGIASQPARRA